MDPHFGIRCMAGHKDPMDERDSSVLRNMPALSSLQHVKLASVLPSVVQSCLLGCTK